MIVLGSLESAYLVGQDIHHATMTLMIIPSLLDSFTILAPLYASRHWRELFVRSCLVQCHRASVFFTVVVTWPLSMSSGSLVPSGQRNRIG